MVVLNMIMNWSKPLMIHCLPMYVRLEIKSIDFAFEMFRIHWIIQDVDFTLKYRVNDDLLTGILARSFNRLKRCFSSSSFFKTCKDKQITRTKKDWSLFLVRCFIFLLAFDIFAFCSVIHMFSRPLDAAHLGLMKSPSDADGGRPSRSNDSSCWEK